MNGGDDSELANEASPEDNSSKSEDEANPQIDVKPEAADVEEGEEDLSDQVIAVVDGYVNVRSMPDENSEIVGKLYNHSAGTWLDKQGDWYKIESGNVVGFVKGEYVKTGQAAVKLAAEVGQRTAVVHTTTLKIREEASIDSAVLGLVANEDQLSVIEETDEWVKVNIEEGDGWVSKEYVSISTIFPKAESKAEEEARLKKEAAERRKAQQAAARSAGGKKTSGGKKTGGGSYSVSGGGLGASVANYALQFVGNPYVYGGTSLTNGTDCSGFTMGVYRNFGVSLPHSSGAQRAMGYGVGSLAEAQPGDIICYSGHVGLYIGGGQIVHASTAATGIKVSNASYRNILAIRRIF
ncbi:MAG: SH3 domain-containing protein [Lachnospiraceae bacterium]|nr:SH3 domain-containing protein [Lachnospiraceae bacterium]